MNILEKIKLLFKLKSIAKDLQSDLQNAKKEVVMNTTVKAGWKTTEFWMTVITHLLNLLAVLGGFIPAQTAVIASAILQCIYNILRSAVKNPDITTIVDNSVVK